MFITGKIASRVERKPEKSKRACTSIRDFRLEKMFKGSLDSIPSPSFSAKIQIKVGMTVFQLFYEIKLKTSRFKSLDILKPAKIS